MRAELEGLAAAAMRQREERLRELTEELALRRRAAEAEGEKVTSTLPLILSPTLILTPKPQNPKTPKPRMKF